MKRIGAAAERAALKDHDVGGHVMYAVDEGAYYAGRVGEHAASDETLAAIIEADVAEPRLQSGLQPSRAAFYQALLTWLADGRRDASKEVEALSDLAVSLRIASAEAEAVSVHREINAKSTKAFTEIAAAVYSIAKKIARAAGKGNSGGKSAGGGHGGAGGKDVGDAASGPGKGGGPAAKTSGNTQTSAKADERSSPGQKIAGQLTSYAEQGLGLALDGELQRARSRRISRALDEASKLGTAMIAEAQEEAGAIRAERRQHIQTIAQLERSRYRPRK